MNSQEEVKRIHLEKELPIITTELLRHHTGKKLITKLCNKLIMCNWCEECMLSACYKIQEGDTLVFICWTCYKPIFLYGQ